MVVGGAIRRKVFVTPGRRALKASAKRGGASHDCALESARRCLRHLCPPRPPTCLARTNGSALPPPLVPSLLQPLFLSAVSAALATASSPAAGAPPLSPSPGIPVSFSLRLLRALYGPSPPPCSGTTSAAASSFSSSLRLSSSCPRRWRPQHRGCMIRLQSSMSNHIPVSSGLFFRVFASPVLPSLSFPSMFACLFAGSPRQPFPSAGGREGRQTSPTRLSFPPSCVVNFSDRWPAVPPPVWLPRLAPFSFHSSG